MQKKCPSWTVNTMKVNDMQSPRMTPTTSLVALLRDISRSSGSSSGLKFLTVLAATLPKCLVHILNNLQNKKTHCCHFQVSSCFNEHQIVIYFGEKSLSRSSGLESPDLVQSHTTATSWYLQLAFSLFSKASSYIASVSPYLALLASVVRSQAHVMKFSLRYETTDIAQRICAQKTLTCILLSWCK